MRLSEWKYKMEVIYETSLALNIIIINNIINITIQEVRGWSWFQNSMCKMGLSQGSTGTCHPTDTNAKSRLILVQLLVPSTNPKPGWSDLNGNHFQLPKQPIKRQGVLEIQDVPVYFLLHGVLETWSRWAWWALSFAAIKQHVKPWLTSLWHTLPWSWVLGDSCKTLNMPAGFNF